MADGNKSVREAARALQPGNFPRVVPIQTRYADLDPQGHVNNARITMLFAEARSQVASAIFERVGRDDGHSLMAGQFAVSYLAQVFFPHLCEIGVGVIEIADRTVRLGQGLFQNGRCCAVAEMVLVCTLGGRAAILGEELRSAWAELTMASGTLPRQLL